MNFVGDFNEATVFSKLDLKDGYHQIELSEDSRGITPFVTNKGLYRYKRLHFGISSASEMYQHIIEQVIQGCGGARNISDDIILLSMERQNKNTTLVYAKCLND